MFIAAALFMMVMIDDTHYQRGILKKRYANQTALKTLYVLQNVFIVKFTQTTKRTKIYSQNNI